VEVSSDSQGFVEPADESELEEVVAEEWMVSPDLDLCLESEKVESCPYHYCPEPEDRKTGYTADDT
jgi:hypothetical protein